VDFVDFNIQPDRFWLAACYSINSRPGQSIFVITNDSRHFL